MTEDYRHREALKNRLHHCVAEACAKAFVADRLFAAPQIEVTQNEDKRNGPFSYKIHYREGGSIPTPRDTEAIEAAPYCAQALEDTPALTVAELMRKAFIDDTDDETPRRIAAQHLIEGWNDFMRFRACEFEKWSSSLIEG